MTQTNDAERPHEFIPGTGYLPENYCQFIKGNAGYCGQPRDAAVHQVAPCGSCGGSGYTSLGICYVCKGTGHEPVAGEAQTTTERLNTLTREVNAQVEHEDEERAVAESSLIRSDAPPDQHVAPPEAETPLLDRVYLANSVSFWYEDYDEFHPFEFVYAAPIQAALEACEANQMGQFNDYVHVRKSDWNALVKSVKGGK